MIALRGAARERLGDALAAAAGADGDAAAKLAAKPLRAPLLLAIVAVVTPEHPKVPEWEQEASAAGVAHLLSLLLDEAGWGVMWRTGPLHAASARRRSARPRARTSACSAGSTSAACPTGARSAARVAATRARQPPG